MAVAKVDFPDWAYRQKPARRNRGAAPWFTAHPDRSHLLTITATTPTGVVPGHPYWPVLLDGILAWVHRRVVRGVAPGQHDQHRPSMPLARIKSRNSSWVWAATRGYFDSDDVSPQYWGRRTDEQFHRVTSARPGRINTSTGKDKSVYEPDHVVMTGTVTWRAIGDPGPVAEWLNCVNSIGDSRRRGQGVVVNWKVEAGEKAGAGDALWLLGGPDGKISRPVHPGVATNHIPGYSGDTILGSPRPPYLDPADTSVGRMTDIPVAAPWTTA